MNPAGEEEESEEETEEEEPEEVGSFSGFVSPGIA